LAAYGNFTQGLPQLRFPKDNPSNYKGVIEFRLVRIEPPTVNLKLAQNLLQTIDEDVGFTTQTAGPGNQPVGGVAAVFPGRKEFPSAYPNVTLYLPKAVVFSDGMDYDNNVQLGVVGAVAETTINAGGSLGDAIIKATTTAASSFTDLFKDLPTQDIARLALARGAGFGGALAGDIASSTLRTTINPNRRTLFRGVRSREFRFSFSMIANSAAEAQEIDNIISFFRRQMYPTSVDVKGVSAGYKYPDPFRIDLKYGSAKVGTSILLSYLTSMDTTYNQSSMGFHVDGKPSEVDINLAFFEERALARQDIEAGY
jgi:hypothetical protein